MSSWQRCTRDEQRLFYARCAVGSVHLLGVYHDDTWDRAVVEVWWSGTRSSIEAGGKVREIGPIGHARLLLVLGRDGTAISRADTAISSAHCPNCGAPQVETTANACESCGTVLNDGKLSWVLMRVESGTSTGAEEVMAQLRAGLASLAPQARRQAAARFHSRSRWRRCPDRPPRWRGLC